MKIFKISPDTLFNLAFDVIASLEKILSVSSLLPDKEIYSLLEEDLGYSLTHIRDIFKLATNISLRKYITRRKYTNILLQMSFEDFDKLTMYATVFKIQKFKSKCLREFPLLNNKYSTEYMQLPIDKIMLQYLLDTQIAKKGEKYLMESLYKDIIKERSPFEIPENSENIIIQTSNGMLIDLEKKYFIFGDKVFKITATLDLMQRQIAEPFFSMPIGQPVYSSYSLPGNTNSIVHALHKFITSNSITTNGFSIILEWSNKHGWGSSNLITLMTFDDDELKDVHFVDNPFLIFDNQNVILNLSFFNKGYYK